MFHKLTVVGHVGRDPEMRYTSDGTPVTSFSVASSRRWNSPDGTPNEETIWFRVSAWRRLAETCNTYVKKGMLVLVEGTFKPDKNGGPRVWTGNDGNARASFEVNATTVRFLSARGETAPVGTPPAEGIEPPAEDDPTDIPF